MWRHAIIILVGVAFSCAADPLPEETRPAFIAAYNAGRADAARDVQRDYLAVEEYGKPPAWSGDYARIAEERFGIHVKVVAGCIVDDNILGHARGYNEVSRLEIERRFGRDVLAEARVAASERWAKSRHK
jgi:hypothetical protein